MLSYKQYIQKFVLGTEFFYVLCMVYGALLSGQAAELHRQLFAVTVPGFVWGSVLSFLWGALFLGIWAAPIGWYVAWMHNSSLK
ncbi:hypothetical protein COV04_01070 [Candidatus Uhrbacteria bacterium CG10_big_fil_rev_8_21_14_0_10_48_11]|uniref:Uncharacterized protein n=1 Tax=Candidatus Uhrbacteria bacterium CG10_big_fil_rev_8_21_14_0_10_48_11 TaxID=1975037 RepID=A0A2M8LF77_9BACT|nr:MAG: hypothetical protein COV04_01070 [Candidatus Uhrbacteria bacterium CG10_big_fil_rev_8_21_14_0_10_48_11]